MPALLYGQHSLWSEPVARLWSFLRGWFAPENLLLCDYDYQSAGACCALGQSATLGGNYCRKASQHRQTWPWSWAIMQATRLRRVFPTASQLALQCYDRPV